MKIRIILFLALCAGSQVLSAEVCECQSKVTLKYYAEPNCSKCPKDCSKKQCSKYVSILSENHNQLSVPIMMCQTYNGRNSNDWFTLDVLAVCDRPSVFFGCFLEVQLAFINETRLMNSSCRKPYHFMTECYQLYSSIYCKNTPEIAAKFPDINETFNLYQPLTLDHFNFIGPRSDYWPPQAESQYELYENLSDMKVNKEILSIEEILALSHHSEDAYNIKANPRLEGFEVLTNTEKNVYAELGYDKELKSIIIAFRGTAFVDNEGSIDLNNIITDLNKKQISGLCDDCMVHTGFYRSYQSIESQLQKKVLSLQEKYPGGLLFTGHSMGAAIASIALVHLTRFPAFSKSSLVTFGSPRVGNDKFADYLNAIIYGKNFRVTYKSDPVPRVPSHPEYQHVGTEIHFNNPSNYERFEKNKDLNGNDYSLTDLKMHSGYWLLAKS